MSSLEKVSIQQKIYFEGERSLLDLRKQELKKTEIDRIINKAMLAIEKENESLKGILPKNYTWPGLDKAKLGGIIDMFTFKISDTESRR